jgi:hypothetical protein
MRIIFNSKEKSGREENSKTKGSLNFNKETRNFSCDASDLDCMGARNLNLRENIDITIEETGNTKTFALEDARYDDEGELQYYLYRSKDKKHEFFIWND